MKKKHIATKIKKLLKQIYGFVSRPWNIWKQFKQKWPKLFSQLKRIVLSLGLSLILLLLCYVFSNIKWSVSLFGNNPLDSTLFRWFENAYKRFHKEDFTPDDVFFVDVSTDYMLVSPSNDTYKRQNYAIPDHDRLLEFLQMIENVSYRQLFIDIDLYPIDYNKLEGSYDSIITKYDSALVSQLLKMKNVFLPRKKFDDTNLQKTVFPLSEEKLNGISYNCDFPIRRSQGNFEKYAFLWGDTQTIALKLYELETGRNIKRWGPFYFDSCKLCTNAKFIFIRDSVRIHDITLKLGRIILDFDENSLKDQSEGKTVFVGSFDGSRDKHSTYNGDRYGPYLHYLGYRALMDGKHIIKWWYVLIMVIVYTAINYFTFFWREWVWLNKKLSAIPALNILFALVGYGLVLKTISFFWYQFDIYHSILIPYVWFTLFSGFVKSKKNTL